MAHKDPQFDPAGTPQANLIQSLGRMLVDPNAGWWTKGFAVLVLLYVISPIDIIPDVVPIFGFADDMVALIGLLVTMFAAARQYGAKRKGPAGLID